MKKYIRCLEGIGTGCLPTYYGQTVVLRLTFERTYSTIFRGKSYINLLPIFVVEGLHKKNI